MTMMRFHPQGAQKQAREIKKGGRFCDVMNTHHCLLGEVPSRILLWP
jgi:hypothetical protein